MADDDFRPAMPHGQIREVFPDLFVVTGGFRFGPGLSITRNMTIVRQGTELTLINSVRLSPKGEAELEALGTPKHLLRIGAFHGADDPYFVQRYRTTLWAPPGTKHERDLRTREELRPGACPIAKSVVLAFEQAKQPEVAIVLEREGGVLVSCDSYQNWETFDGCSLLGKGLMSLMGFGPVHIGGPWAKQMGPGVRADFARLRELSFAHLIPGHGEVLRDRARQGLDVAIGKRFGAKSVGA